MIIKKIIINKFGALSNFKLDLSNGINIVYGENEKGKSTIEAFIKIMLYGFSKKKISGESERNRYMPFNENSMGGELLVQVGEMEYIIRRSFGSAKKEDKSIVLDALSGEEVVGINKEEPGKSFLGINRSTFEKTLFVSQLGVVVTKDKEDEIMDKITTIFGCGEEEIPVAKAISKLNLMKKSLTTVRGAGELDLLKKREQSLIEEYYEANKICEKNLKWEEELYLARDKRKVLEDEIVKLEVYKKYIKKVNLQKEYKEIAEYLKRSEELKKKKEEIKESLLKGDQVINEEYIDSLKEKYNKYIILENRIAEIIEEKKAIIEDRKKYEEEAKEYSFISDFGDGIKEKIIKLKYEQESLKEKVDFNEKTLLEINDLEKELENYQKDNSSYFLIKDIKNNVEETFKEYEKKLYEIRALAEKKNINKDVNKLMKLELIKIIVGGILVIGGVSTLFLGFPISILGIVLLIAGTLVAYKSFSEGKKLKVIINISNEINNIEKKLDNYCLQVKVNSYGDLMNLSRKYTKYIEMEEKIKIKLLEKRNSFSEESYIDNKNNYNKNKMYLGKLIALGNCFNIDELIDKISIYEKILLKIQSLSLEIENKSKAIEINKENLNEKEEEIRSSLKVINLEDIEINNLERYLNDYSNKIKRYREIHNNLNSIEETYKVLLKDRDIEEIKKDLVDIIDDNNPYSFNNEEEVEIEEKKKSKELLECEKSIKDLENSINTRLIGKRDIVTIEEELSLVREKIEKESKKCKALELSIKIMEESLTEVRREIGPEINRLIGENFSELTNEKYNEVLLGENYDMMVRDNSNLFKGSYLSNGAMDQLYLSLRIALIQLLFPNEEIIVILDDALIQYDDKRRKDALKLLSEKVKGQLILFTCQNIEADILSNENIEYRYESIN